MKRATALLAMALLAKGVRADIDLYRIKPQSIEECEGLVREHPQDLEAWRCYAVVANKRGQWEAAARRLERHLTAEPDNDRARLSLGMLEAYKWSDRAEPLLRQVIDAFVRKGDRTGEVHARVSLYFWLTEQGRLAEASPQLVPAEEAARSTGDPTLRALVLYHRGLDAELRGDLGQALESYRRVEAMVFPDGRPYLQVYVLNGLGVVHWRLGRFREALEAFRRAAEVDRRTKDLWDEGTQRLNMAEAAARLVARGEMAREEWRRLVEEARVSAGRGGNRRAEASVHLLLAEDETLPLDRRIVEAGDALALTRRAGLALDESEILCLLARLRLQQDPSDSEPALRLTEEAIRITSGVSTPDATLGLLARARVHQHRGDREAATRDRLAALELIERQRDLQPDDLLRSYFFSQWAFAYYDLIDALLEPAGSEPPPAELALAFTVAERLRARALLDALDGAGASARIGARAEGYDARAAVLGRITRLQRRLLGPGVETGARPRLLAELERLENEEEALRDAIARRDPWFAALRRPPIPSLAEVQQALAPDQALLSYQLGTGAAGSASLFVVTRETARVVALSDRATIEAAVTQLLGLLEWRDGSERRGASRLHHLLVGKALEVLPDGIERLVVIPDGLLHRLPFDALRADAAAEPLGAHVEVTIAPSAAVWLRLRRSVERGSAMSALALADPELATAQGDTAALRQAAPWAESLRLGRLAHARDEARALTRHLGRGSRLLLGPDASERSFKTAAGAGFRVLHLAAHAVTDDDKPERSAVLLAPGAGEEDGLLQIREIVELDLPGPVVILSACRSASGAVLAGEGVMGLARGFLQAGARAVVGSLWPLRDDEAATLVEGLARGLGEGRSVGQALAAVRRERSRAAAPTAAWAGLVVIGDGDFVPFPGGARHRSNPLGIAGVGALVIALAAALVFLGRRRRHDPLAGY